MRIVNKRLKYQTILMYRRSKANATALVKWMICSVIIGIISGFIGYSFGELLGIVTAFRTNHSYMLFFLPIIGLFIVAMYNLSGEKNNTGTNLVIGAIQKEEHVPLKITPLIYISTIFTHLGGGSVGREGAALQMGGSIGNFIAKLFKLDKRDSKVLIMCGMSAFFAALFGTPIAASIFAIEVVSIGIMHYSALVPCISSSLIASGISRQLGLEREVFPVETIEVSDIGVYCKLIIFGIICAFVSIVFILTIKGLSKLCSNYLTNPYIKVVIAGALIIALTLLLQNRDFLGAGTNIIEESFESNSPWYYFLLKIIFTAITIVGGFKGGEIVPTLFIGATLGSFVGGIFGLSTDLCAACGMVGIFCGVTNCPITSLFLSVELFGAGNIVYYVVVIALSYMLSDYYSLYSSQKFMYSKTKTEYINHSANKVKKQL